MNHFDLIADHITPFLLLSLNENIRTTDDSNVKSRTIKIFQDTIQDIDFNNEEIVKLLKDLFIKKSKELKESLVSLHKSMALDITRKRLEMMEAMTTKTSNVAIEERLAPNGEIMGTIVILKLPIQYIK